MVDAIHQFQYFGSARAAAQDSDCRKEWSWKEFLRDPSKSSDNPSSIQNPRQPDLKHNFLKEPLWMESCGNPPWFTNELISCGVESEQCIEMAADASFPQLLRACGKSKDIFRGIGIHEELLRRGLAERDYSDALIAMYAKCGEVQKAQALLDMHNSSSVITWTALISGYARLGQGQRALDCFDEMQHEGIPPNAVTYVCILKACAVIGAIDKGEYLHREISRQGLLEDSIVLGGALVDMYAKCGALPQALSVLGKLPSRNVILWNAMITGYIRKGQGQQALEGYKQMQREGISPTVVTYVCILKACALIGAIDKGKQIHDEISRQGLLESSVELGGALVDMYAKCGALPKAQSVLERLPSRNVVMWNALITGYAQNGQGQQALECFEKMQCEGIPPSAVTYLLILKACAMIGAVDKGKQIHDEISRQGLLEHSVVLGNALVDMYAKCGALPSAQSVLEKLPSRDVVCWNALLAGYAQNRQIQQALDCFEQLQHEGISPDAVTYVCILNVCAVIGDIDKGKHIHNEILRQGLLEHSTELGGALVDMYAKCGSLSQARKALERLPYCNVVGWSALIAGYVQKEQGHQALECFKQMQREGIPPDAVTYLSVLRACAVIGSFDKGKQIHDEILRHGLLKHDIVLGNAVVDMYAKCGALLQAHSVLEKLPLRTIVSWNALIAGYAQEGQADQALKCFDQMQNEGILPDKVTFFCLLSLCSHQGLVERGQELFDSMGARYGLKPDVTCFTCMVDLYGRAGHLVKAVELIQEMPCSADSAIWLTLLGACWKWVDINVGVWAFEQAVELDKCGEAAYILMAHIYAVTGLPEKAKEIDTMRIENKTVRVSVDSHPNNMVHD